MSKANDLLSRLVVERDREIASLREEIKAMRRESDKALETQAEPFRAARCCPVSVTCEREGECSGMCPIRCRPQFTEEMKRHAQELLHPPPRASAPYTPEFEAFWDARHLDFAGGVRFKWAAWIAWQAAKSAPSANSPQEAT